MVTNSWEKLVNKRIKKKKAKQAALKQEQVDLQLTPEQIDEVVKIVLQVFADVGRAMAEVVAAILAAFKEVSRNIENIIQQRPAQLGQGAIQAQNH